MPKNDGREHFAEFANDLICPIHIPDEITNPKAIEFSEKINEMIKVLNKHTMIMNGKSPNRSKKVFKRAPRRRSHEDRRISHD